MKPGEDDPFQEANAMIALHGVFAASRTNELATLR
jgi:hypothetical protein